MLLEGVCSRPPPKDANSGPVSGVEIMRKLSKSHTHNESALRIKVKCVCCEAAIRHLGLCVAISSPLDWEAGPQVRCSRSHGPSLLLGILRKLPVDQRVVVP